MDICSNQGENILQRWFDRQCLIRAELISGNVSLSFTGTVARFNNIEVVLQREIDEMSVSLFAASCKVMEPRQGQEAEGPWKFYRLIVQIQTDGGAQCVLHELREGAELRAIQ